MTQQGQAPGDFQVGDRSSSPKSKSPNQGVKKGLPTLGLIAAEELASNLWEVARKGSVPDLAFATQLGRSSASGSRWDSTVALLRGFGLIERANEQLRLSPLGLEVIDDSDPARQREARRKAVLTLKSYASLVDSFDGTELPDIQALARRLKFEYGKTDDFAARAAAAFKQTLERAEMITAEGVVRKDGAEGEVQPGLVQIESEGDVEEEIDQAFDENESIDGDISDGEASVEQGQPYLQREPGGERGMPLGHERLERQVQIAAPAGFSLEVTLDLSGFSAAEVVDILKVLGYRDRE